eukprot:GFKZ01007453.1.p2 GENE.GFKZ01007453.1~~GFKZ01007453.1.p2  ORF type:complete len:107 (+),score=3.18 GFKZ01007453.1:570-890(+)
MSERTRITYRENAGRLFLDTVGHLHLSFSDRYGGLSGSMTEARLVEKLDDTSIYRPLRNYAPLLFWKDDEWKHPGPGFHTDHDPARGFEARTNRNTGSSLLCSASG